MIEQKKKFENKIFNSSRYSPAPCYLNEFSNKYNDIQLNIDNEVLSNIVFNFYFVFDLDCPPTIAGRFAHLLSRDPLYVNDEQVCPTNDQPKAYL